MVQTTVHSKSTSLYGKQCHRLHLLFVLLIPFSSGKDSCLPNPCQHAGTCLQAHTNRGYHCLCPAGFRGYVCERKYEQPKMLVSLLNKGPMSRAGIAMTFWSRLWLSLNYLNVPFQFSFFFSFFFSFYPGADLCYPTNPCFNGGICYNALDTYICHCPLRYTGNNCTSMV